MENNPFRKTSTYIHTPIFQLLLRFAALLLLYTLCRLIFFWCNASYFPEAHISHFISGLRYDIAAITLLNIPYFLLLLLPFNFIAQKSAIKIGDFYFVIANSIGIMANLIDTCYYPFSLRRMTFDIFNFMGATNNMGELIPLFLRDYYYMIFIFLAFIFTLIVVSYFANKLNYNNFAIKGKLRLVQIAIRLMVVALLLIGARGGLQLRPITVAAAGGTGGVEYASLILNSPFSLINTIGEEQLEGKYFFSEETCEQNFSLKRISFENQYFTPPQTDNIVVIILEGTSSEYSSFLADEPKSMAGFTPFLDSLAKQSITYRGMANGQHSIEAVSSILGGIPALMEKPFSQSRYATAYVSYALPLLKERGMSTHFYHGGLNGTMGFDRMSQLAGIEHYYGMNEYPTSKRDFDGSWGIPDVPYLNYVARQLDQIDGHFFATIFTLSSHHPFKVPAEYDYKLPKGDIAMQHAVAYEDEALRQFFEKVSKTDWYQNTLFVITADHTTFDDAKDIDFQRHKYAIPMLFFHPQQKEVYHASEIMQQVDILPSIFGYCGFTGAFCSFGNNVFDDSTPRFSIAHQAGMFQMYIDHYLIDFDGNKILNIWDLNEKMPRSPLAPESVPDIKEYETLIKSVIQQFHNGLINNKLHVK